ncbi:hypothetical protein VUN82_24610 [Micrococcaceae bacterium Sec5.1]
MENVGGSQDADEAERETSAVRLLMDRGGSNLSRRPWLAPSQPPAAMDLIQHVLWRSRGSDQGADANLAPVEASDLRGALALVAAARGEMDAVETALLFLARAEGLTWPQIAESLGLRSAQAAQQRLDRLSDRPNPGVR